MSDRGSHHLVELGDQLSLAEVDSATASDGEQPLPTAERTGAIDPDLPVIALQSGRRKSRKWPFRDSRRAIFRGAEKITGASASVQEVMREAICPRKPRACLN
jgi:hypothetical protein